MSNIYRDDPPTEPGWYYVRNRGNLRESIVRIPALPGYISIEEMPEIFQFGPRVPDAATCVSVDEVTSGLLTALTAFIARYDNHIVNADLLFSDVAIQAREAIAKAAAAKYVGGEGS